MTLPAEHQLASFENYQIFLKYAFFDIAFSTDAFFFAGCTTVLILAISTRFMIKKKAPVDPLFYGMNSQMHVFSVFREEYEFCTQSWARNHMVLFEFWI